ncbi:MAG: 2-phospho-L-lactate transferase [Candidatus Hadarchaeum sp.]|uniref:2-phospho-L-lactate transferase n=1 Tax=Candidatus Hadarchaeum sp. TaxID=2883567 RepID=UPI003D0D54F3
MLTVLSGGTGTPKLLQGLVHLVKQEELSIIVNTGEDLEISGLYVSPDIDTVMYTLAGIVNEETWYGIRGDTFEEHERLRREGRPELLRIGDRDREVKKRRTLLLQRGHPLSAVTRELCKNFHVLANVLPMSDDRVTTHIDTEAGVLTFHEFWVARRARDRVRSVTFDGAESARAAPGVLEAIENSEAVIIGPSNPVTSIGPIVAIKEIRSALEKARKKIIAVSPIVGSSPVSGPAGVLMSGMGYEVSPLGVARYYRDFTGKLVIDKRDEGLAPKIEELGLKTFSTDLMMPDLPSRIKLARSVLAFAGLKIEDGSC